MTHDLVIRNAHLVDGSGQPGRDADVAVDGDTITAVEPPGTIAAGTRTVDAHGLLLTPGFVDVHTHYDAQVTWDPYVTPSGWHGVTTALMGNCGVGFAPASPDRHEWLIQLMEGVEDIPGSALTEGIKWGWESYPEYLDVLEQLPRVMDIGSSIAHGPLRAYVMGERGAANAEPTDAEIVEMARLVEEALRAGAFGFTTSRTPIHKAKDGELVPGTTADEHELLGIAAAIARVGRGVFGFAPDHALVPVQEWPWMRKVAALTGQPICVNLNQSDKAPEVWREVLRLLDEAHADGLPIIAQVAGRSIGILYCLQGSVHPLLFHPAYQEIADLPLAERLVALAEPERRRRIIDEIPDDGGFFQSAVLNGLGRIWLVDGENIDYEPDAVDSVAAVAARAGVPAMQLVLDQLTAHDGNGMLYAPFFNYSYGDLSFTEAVTRHPHTRMGLSDGGAHCGAICDGGMPTFMLTHWTRDRTRGEKLPLEYVVHRQTSQTAALYGIADRGVVAPGMRADLNLIDYGRLGFEVPRMAYDLPAGGRRIVQKARGYVGTWVAGVQTVDHDEFTGATPGTLLRAGR
ncbi:MAG: amidohydrolase family protein [Ilumatobacteraceae bacterium]|nr:amidohydrolase family protein [Ilumatobacteraceae bacterium]HQY86174.1 amidohydrolase family protein [Ilumatobacteraceae bacterium]HRA85883.1 amidohydrolase family protein [Ilumatobacteraceae bacterium]